MRIFDLRKAAASLMLLLALGWSLPTHAFFCLFPDKANQRNAAYGRLHHYPPPPRYPRGLMLPASGAGLRNMTPKEIDPPPIIPAKLEPEIIDGYRFRPHKNRPQAAQSRSGMVSREK